MIHWAALGGHAGIVETLLKEFGCDPDQPGGKSDEPAIVSALRAGSTEAAEAILSHRPHNGRQERAQVDAQDGRGRTPLHWAAKHGRVKEVDWLVARGADIAAKDGKGRIPKQVAYDCGKWKAGEHLASVARRRYIHSSLRPS